MNTQDISVNNFPKISTERKRKLNGSFFELFPYVQKSTKQASEDRRIRVTNIVSVLDKLSPFQLPRVRLLNLHQIQSNPNFGGVFDVSDSNFLGFSQYFFAKMISSNFWRLNVWRINVFKPKQFQSNF